MSSAHLPADRVRQAAKAAILAMAEKMAASREYTDAELKDSSTLNGLRTLADALCAAHSPGTTDIPTLNVTLEDWLLLAQHYTSG